MQPTARSLILDLLSTVRRGTVPVRALVEAAGLFGIAANSLRVALARLRSEGLVARDERGRYRLGPRAAAVSRELRGWHRLEERLVPWSGGWIGVVGAAPSRGRARRERALHFLGFRGLRPGLELRPDNLAGGAADTRERLRALGLEEEALVCALSDLGADEERRARSLWDEAALCRGYREAVARLGASAARLPDLPRREAMAESFLLGGDAIRQLVLDPLLPEPFVPAAERRALVETARRYDRLGREAWAGWLGAEADSSDPCPAGVRGLDGAGAVLRAAAGEA